MKLTLAEPKYLKDSISIISDIVNEAKFTVGSNGLELVAMDPANVAMVVFKLLPPAFLEYQVDNSSDLCINLSNLKQVLRRVNPTDTLTLETVDNKLKITLKGSSTRSFHLPLLEIDDKEQKIPSLNFIANIETESSVLNNAVEDCDIVAEAVSLIASNDKFAVSGEGDLSTAHVKLEANDFTKVLVNSEDNISSKYSIEYLKKMMQASKLADRVSISFSRDYPLKLDYKTPDRVSMEFILAPRVEND